MTLRFIGIRGVILVAVEFRNNLPEQEINGRLVIELGGQITLLRKPEPSRKACSIQAFAPSNVGSDVSLQTLRGIYPLSEVLRIRKLIDKSTEPAKNHR